MGQGLTCWPGQGTNAGKLPKAISQHLMVLGASLWCELDGTWHVGVGSARSWAHPVQGTQWLRLDGSRRGGREWWQGGFGRWEGQEHH